jgi:D-amino peptidase
MKIYVQTDLEGVAGFCFFENREPKDIESVIHRQRMYRLLTGEVNAAVRAAFDSGAREVYVNDSHGSGYNLIFEELDARCRIIHGANCSGPHWLPKLDSSFDALILVGMHAMGGTARAITPHTRWKINDGELFLSEGSMAAAIAGDLDVPTVMVSGDDKIVAEMKEKIPAIETATVKEALSPYQACSLTPALAQTEIAAAIKRGLNRRDDIAPYRIPGPIKLILLSSPHHTSPWTEEGFAVTADTVGNAFMSYLRTRPWAPLDTIEPNGYQYP